MINGDRLLDSQRTRLVGRRRSRRASSVCAVLLCGLLIVVGIAAHPAPAAATAPDCAGTRDLDGDLMPDTVVGEPGVVGGATPRDGYVQIFLSNGRTETIYGEAPGFGSSVTFVCDRLVIGSPYETWGGKLEAGVVHVYAATGWGTIEEYALYAPGRLGVPGSPQQGAHFGAAVATSPGVPRTGDPDGQRVYVGIPGEDVNGVVDAGRVTSFVLGSEEGVVGKPRTTTYATPGVAGVPSTKAGLGSSISVDEGVAAFGAPGQPADGVAGAGKVLVESVSADFDPYSLSQASKNFPGNPETGDKFGWSVHVAPGLDGSELRLLIGAPDETVGGIARAGTVAVIPLNGNTGRPNGTIVAWDQDSPGMSGAMEAGDRFGWSVTSAVIEDLQELVVGVPYEAVGDRAAAGMVQTIRTRHGWTQSSPKVPGTPEAGDLMGASLSGSTEGLVIGVPGENGNSGAVLVGTPSADASPELLLPLGSNLPLRFGTAVQ